MADAYTRPGRLPAPATSLIGRDEDVEFVTRLLAAHRLITLTGTGGSGKTRLAIAVARSLDCGYADGAVFVDLQATSGRTEVASAIGTALGLPQHPNQDVEDSLFFHLLPDLECLLVLDNFEQVISAGPLVMRLLEATRGVDVLVTSRAPLRLSAEHEFVVAPLRVPDPAEVTDSEDLLRNEAVALFISRSQAVGASLVLSAEEMAVVAEITRRLDGLPLAIELAAAKMRWLAPPALLQRLDHSLPLLDKGPRDAPERQRTLRATFDWSYDLLEEPVRTLLAHLSVFAGGWSMDAAERVCGTEGGSDTDVAEGIEVLVENSLVRPMADEQEEARFTMLQVVREFAGEKLAETPDRALTPMRHAEWVRDLVETVEPELIGRDPRAWQRSLRIEEENIRTALRWAIAEGPTEQALDTAGRLFEFWHYWAEIREGVDWLEAVLAMPGATDPSAARAKALGALANLRLWQGRQAEAASLLEEALVNLEDVDDPRELASLHRAAMWTAFEMDDADSARHHATEWWRSYQDTADSGGGRSLDRTLEILASINERASSARVAEVIQEDIEARGQAERPLEEAAVTTNLAWVHYLGGRHDLALEAGREAVRMMYQLGHIGRLGPAFKIIAATESALGRPERAVLLGTVAHRLSSELGALPSAWWTKGVRDPVDEAAPQLSAEAHARAVAAGRSISLADAVSYALSDRSTVPPSSRPRRAGRHRLTAREQEVLDLIVDGRTDGEIAEALFISPKTASVHVSNIKGKLGAGSRVEIATVAMRSGLARLDAGSGQ